MKKIIRIRNEHFVKGKAKAKATKAKTSNWDFIKLKIFCKAKETI